MTDSIPTDSLVSPDWLAANLDRFQSADPAYRLLEVDIEQGRYRDAHIPGATLLDWREDLRDTARFDLVQPEQLSTCLGDAGITNETTIVLYGDFDNWFAAHAYWILRYYRHANLYILDGGRGYWLENDFPTTEEVPSFPGQAYDVPAPDTSIRADRDYVEAALESDTTLVDVRAPPEYNGEILSPPGWNEGVQRGGHIPGAVNVPWSRAIRPDGRFKPETELRDLYDKALGGADETILYCRIGERSAVIWFVLHELLGYERVKHYYGSWVEWGNTVGLPVERETAGDLK